MYIELIPFFCPVAKGLVTYDVIYQQGGGDSANYDYLGQRGEESVANYDNIKQQKGGFSKF